VAQEQLPDPFGDTRLVATLPPARPVATVACVALFIALALVLLAVRGVVG